MRAVLARMAYEEVISYGGSRHCGYTNKFGYLFSLTASTEIPRELFSLGVHRSFITPEQAPVAHKASGCDHGRPSYLQ